jgi:hypothetical protein
VGVGVDGVVERCCGRQMGGGGGRVALPVDFTKDNVAKYKDRIFGEVERWRRWRYVRVEW